MDYVDVKNARDLPRWLYAPAGDVTLETAVQRYRERFGAEPVIYRLGKQVFIGMPEPGGDDAPHAD